MDVLMVTAELAPYASVTATADVVLSLTKGLRQLGHRVTIALPRYAAFEEHGLLLARRLTPLRVGGSDVTLFDGQHSSGAELVLFDVPGLNAPSELATPEPEPRVARAYEQFGRAAAALAAHRREQQPFDVIHAHDWPGGLIAAELGREVPFVLSVYDAQRPALKTALASAHVVVLPSSSYADKLADRAVSGPLAEVFAGLAQPAYGVTTGLDYSIFNPATDPALESRYDAEEASAKARTKGVIQRELRLELDIHRPLIVYAGPLDTAHGADLVLSALPELGRLRAALVVASTTPSELSERFRAAALERPESLAFVELKDHGALRRLYAAADLALVVPRDVPCETAQLIAQRYGAFPVAYAADAVKDTVVDADAALETGTGFLFDRLERGALVGAVERALAALAVEEPCVRLRRRVMRLDLSWDRAARRYAQVYRRAIEAASAG
jgi:starch synthase